MAKIIGTSGNNTLNGTSADDFISGLAGNDILSGLGGNDLLIGGAGTDTAIFSGPLSDYSFTVGALGGGFKLTDNNAANGNDGTDFTVGNEVLQFSDAKVEIAWNPGDPISVAHNPSEGGGNDILDGKSGADTMSGGIGDDVYYIDNIKDVVKESSGQGNDEVRSAIDYTLPANLENLTLLGTAGHGTGNDPPNAIIGNYVVDNVLSGLGGNDLIIPLGGNDTIDGGAGRDAVQFNEYVRDAHFSESGPNQFTMTGPEGTDTVSNVETLSFIGLTLDVSDRSKFDPIWYLESNRDVANANIDPLSHYKNYGWAEGRTPNSHFDLSNFDGLEYIASYGDLIKAFGDNATVGKAHCAQAGLFEDRSVSFDGLQYLASYPDLVQAFTSRAARTIS